MTTASLNDLGRGDLGPAETRALLSILLKDPSSELGRDVYLALRAWVWKALDQRRRDQELREWEDIILSTAAMLRRLGQDVSQKLLVLQELLRESVATGERMQVIDVRKRQHVGRALAFVAQKDGFVSRATIGQELCLEQANLTRVLNMTVTAGLMERATLGKEAAFRLTVAGSEAVAPEVASSTRRTTKRAARSRQVMRALKLLVADSSKGSRAHTPPAAVRASIIALNPTQRFRGPALDGGLRPFSKDSGTRAGYSTRLSVHSYYSAHALREAEEQDHVVEKAS